MSFKNIFDNGGDQAGSAGQSADALNKDTPGAGDVSEAVRKLERERDPWLVRQTAHGAFDVMGFLGPLFQNAQGAAAAQQQLSANPGSTSTMASATTKAFGPPKVSIGDDDMPKLEDLSKLIAKKRNYTLIATGLGLSEGVAVDASRNTVYVGDRGGQKLYAVKLDTGAQRVVASGLGDIGDVVLDGQGTAYTTDWSGGRLLAVDLAAGSSRKIADVTGAYGVALDGAGKAYVANWSEGQLIAVDLPGGQKTTIATGLGQGIAAVALNGRGKAYLGRKDAGGGKLHEVDLAGRTHRVVADLSGGTPSAWPSTAPAGRTPSTTRPAACTRSPSRTAPSAWWPAAWGRARAWPWTPPTAGSTSATAKASSGRSTSTPPCPWAASASSSPNSGSRRPGRDRPVLRTTRA